MSIPSAGSVAVKALHCVIPFVMLCVLSAPLEAHSFDRAFASARYAMRLDASSAALLVVVEMPTIDVLGDFRRFLRDHPAASDSESTELFRRQQLAHVASALELRLDGERFTGEFSPVESPANGLGDTDFFLYMVETRVPLPGARRLEIELENRLLPAKVLFMSTAVDLSGGWRVAEDSSAPLLAAGLDGTLVGPDVGEAATGKWSTDEKLRSWHLVLARGE